MNKNTSRFYSGGYVDALFDLCSALDIINLDLDSAPMPCSILKLINQLTMYGYL